MSFCDPVSDALTRIRNATMINKKKVRLRASKMVAGVLDVMQREGYIHGYETISIRPGVSEIQVKLKYYAGKPVINTVTRVSKPGCRHFSQIKLLKKVDNGLGISVVSTSKGILSDLEARQQNVGGEVLCTLN